MPIIDDLVMAGDLEPETPSQAQQPHRHRSERAKTGTPGIGRGEPPDALLLIPVIYLGRIRTF